MKSGTVNLDVEDMHDHSVAFFDAYGRLMAEWAAIERALFGWFAGITGMKEGMARAIFYSAKNFTSRSDMLEATLDSAVIQTSAEIEFIKAALRKARGYSGFRNSVVHGEPSLEMVTTPGTLQADIQYVLVQGKNVIKSAAISIDDLEAAFENFMELRNIIVQAMPRHRPADLALEECIQRVLALPNPPNSLKKQMNATSPTPTEAEIERRRVIARRAMAGMGAGTAMRVRRRSPNDPPSEPNPK